MKSGAAEVRAPRYDHLTYDILAGDEMVVRRPDVLIVEGLNVLQPAHLDETGRSALALSDFFDFSIYVDAHPVDVRRWYVERFLRLRETAFADPDSYFRRYAELTDARRWQTANGIWASINEPNLVENILPTRGRATLVMTKGPDHAVSGSGCASSDAPTRLACCIDVCPARSVATRCRRPGSPTVCTVTDHPAPLVALLDGTLLDPEDAVAPPGRPRSAAR